MSNPERSFEDPQLRRALQREAADRRAPAELRASVEAIFSAPPSIPIGRPWRSIGAVAACLLLALMASAFLLLRHSEDDEYLIAEAKLWPAMAELQAIPVTTKSVLVKQFTVPKLAGAEFVGARLTNFAGVQAVVARYVVEGHVVTLVHADAREILTDTHHTETYHEFVGDVQLAGGNQGDDWLCILSDKSTPLELLQRTLARTELVRPATDNP